MSTQTTRQISVQNLSCNCQSVSNQHQRCKCEAGEDFTCLLTETATRPSMKREHDNAGQIASVMHHHQNSSNSSATNSLGNSTTETVPCDCNCSTPSLSTTTCNCMSDSDEQAHCSHFTCSVLPDSQGNDSK